MDESSPDEMFCSSCGERIRRSVNFCRHCGEPNRHGHEVGWGPAPDRRDQQDRTADQYDPAAAEGGSRENRGPESRESSTWDGPGAASDRPDERDGWERTRRGVPAGDQHRRDQAAGDPHRWDQAAGDPDRPGAGPDAPPADESIPWRSYLPAGAWRPDEPTWRTVGGAIGIGVLGFVLLVIISVVVAGIGFAAGLSLAAILLGGTVVGQYIGFFGLSLWYLRHRGLDWEAIKGYLGVRKPTLKELGLVLGAWFVLLIGAILVSVLAQLLAELLGAGEPGEAEQDITQVLAENPEFVPIAILIMFLVVGPCEEILFRGVVQGRLREHLSPVPAIGIASVFFAVLHVGGIGGDLSGILVALSVLTVAGVVLGSVYEYTENLVVVSLLHGFHNSMIVLFIYADAVYDLEGSVLTPLVVALPV